MSSSTGGRSGRRYVRGGPAQLDSFSGFLSDGSAV
jgi:hypothetical protein